MAILIISVFLFGLQCLCGFIRFVLIPVVEIVPQPENKKGLPLQVSLMWYRNVSSDTNTPNSLPLQARMMMGVDVMN
jgi:hypothetical protein